MARYRRSRRRELLAATVVVLVVVLRLVAGDPRGDDSTASPTSFQPGVYQIERVVDGDTLLLKGGRIRIRLQGVDTPETVRKNAPVETWGPEASAFTKAFVREAAGRVRVEIDGRPLDRHGRHLAFLWHGDRLLNEELIRHGLARATLQYDFSEGKKQLLRSAQREAKRAAVGIWSSH